MKELITTAVATILVLPTSPGDAQSSWSLDVRAGAAFPTSDLRTTNLDTDSGFEGTGSGGRPVRA